MYGFGDDANPRQDSIELVEDLMIEYLETIVSSIYSYIHIVSYLIFLFYTHSYTKRTKFLYYTVARWKRTIYSSFCGRTPKSTPVSRNCCTWMRRSRRPRRRSILTSCQLIREKGKGDEIKMGCLLCTFINLYLTYTHTHTYVYYISTTLHYHLNLKQI